MTRSAIYSTVFNEPLGLASAILILTYAVLAYQRFRFQNGLTIGVSLAAVTAFSASGTRLGIGPERLERLIVGCAAILFTILAQKMLH